MFKYDFSKILLAVLISLSSSALLAQTYGVGKTLTNKEIEGWNIDVRPDGQGLPKGSGSAVTGKPLYVQYCAACHGQNGEGKPSNQLVGGRGSLNTAKPIMTVGSYWPYATIVFDYINRAMPFHAPQSLKPDEVYGITAYLLFLNQIIPENEILDAKTLPKVVMPNRYGFISDPRPDLHNNPCRDSCKP